MTAGRVSISLKKDWGTPLKYVKAVKSFFNGTIDLDPCSNIYSIVGAKKEFIYPEKDGLKEEWKAKRIYVNPPYGSDKETKTSIKLWLAKCASANDKYKSEVLALVPVAVNTDHWKKYVFIKSTAVCFLYDTRLKFLENGLDVGKGAPMACAMVYWGKDYSKFFNEFIQYGAVVNLTELHNKKIGTPHEKPQKQFDFTPQ